MNANPSLSDSLIAWFAIFVVTSLGEVLFIYICRKRMPIDKLLENEVKKIVIGVLFTLALLFGAILGRVDWRWFVLASSFISGMTLSVLITRRGIAS